MVDVYSIAFKADSREVKQAKSDFEGLGRQTKASGNSVNQFGRQVDQSQKQMKAMRSSTQMVTRALGAFAGALSLNALKNFTQSTIAAADNINKMAQTAGVGAERLQELRFAFGQLAGTTDLEVDQSLRRFNRRLGLAADGGGAAVKTFEQLNIALKDSGGQARSSELVLNDLLKALGSVENDSRRAALASQAFGEDAGPRLAAGLKDGNAALEEQADLARQLGLVLGGELLDGATEVQDAFAELTQQLRTDFQRVILENTDALLATVDAMNDLRGFVIDNSNEFRTFGEVVSILVSLRLAKWAFGAATGIRSLATAAALLTGPAAPFVLLGGILAALRLDFLNTREELDKLTESIQGFTVSQIESELENLRRERNALVADYDQTNPFASADPENVNRIRDISNEIEVLNDRLTELQTTEADTRLETVTVRASDSITEYSEAMSDILGTSVKIPGPIDDISVATKKATDDAGGLGQNFEEVADQVEGAFSDAFYNIFEDGLGAFQDLAGDILDIFRRTLADMAAAAIREQIVIPITQQIVGGASSALGLGGSAGSMLSSVGNFALSSGGGGGGLGSIASSVGRSILSPGASLGQSFAMSGIGQSLGLSGSLSAAGGGLIQGGAGAMGGQALTGAGSALAGAAGIALPLLALALLGGLFGDEPEPSAARVFATGSEGFLDFVPSIDPGDIISQKEADELEQKIDKDISGQARSLQKAVMNTVGMSMAERLSTGIVSGDIQEPFIEAFFDEEDTDYAGAINALLARLFRPLNEFIPGAVSAAIDQLDPESDRYADELMAVTETFSDVNRAVAQELGDFAEETELVGENFVEKLQNLASVLTALDRRGDLDLVDQIGGFGTEAENIAEFVETANAVDQISNAYKDQDQIVSEARERLNEFSEEAGFAGDAVAISTDIFRSYIEGIDLTTHAGRRAAQSALEYSDSLQVVAQEQEQLNQELQNRRSLETELLGTFNRSAQALQRQLMGMTEQQAALQIAITLRQQVAEAERAVANEEQNLIAIYEEQASAATNLADSWKDATQSLREAADDLLGVSATGSASFQQTLQRALSGDIDAFGELPGLAQELSDVRRAESGTLAESRRANAQIAADLDLAADFAQKQYNEQLSDAEVARRQLDKLQDQDRTLSEVKDSLARSRSVLSATQQASIQAIDNVRTMMPMSIVTGLLKPLSPLGAIEANTAAMINSLNNLDVATSQETAVRTEGGTAQAFNESFYLQQKAQQLRDIQHQGRTDWAVSDVRAAFRDASLTPQAHFEIFGREEGLSPAPGFADGGIASGPMSGFPATLHGTEAVIPLNGQRIPLEVNNQEMIQEIRDLRTEVKQLKDNQEQSQYEIVKFTKRNNRQFEQWDIEGLPPAREEV